MAGTPILLDWTAERLRAWAIAPQGTPRSIALDTTDSSLPLVISLAERRLQLGRAAQALVRKQPHQVIERFLPYLGSDRVWQHRRHALDARESLAFVFSKLREKLPAKSLFHVVPSYWNREQAALLEDQTRQSGYRSLGTIKRGLALAGLTPGVTIDVDSHAATVSHTRVQSRSGSLQLEQVQSLADLALPIWCERIAAQVANRCMRDSRRDPRAQSDTDQQLYDQILEKLYDWSSHQDARIELKHGDWQSEVLVPVDEVLSVCAPLAQRLAQFVLVKSDAEGWFLSPEATRLPAVPQALYQGSRNQRSLSVIQMEMLPQTLTNWILHIDQGHTTPPQLSDTMPLVSEGKSDARPDTLPFQKRAGRG
ncbi:MAG: hypothetical protein QM703_23545 [Gemmatales bacterium]